MLIMLDDESDECLTFLTKFANLKKSDKQRDTRVRLPSKPAHEPSNGPKVPVCDVCDIVL